MFQGPLKLVLDQNQVVSEISWNVPRTEDGLQQVLNQLAECRAVGDLEQIGNGLLELSYKAQLTAWWTLQPSVQWVVNPGGGTDFVDPPADAIAFVLQTTLRF